MKRHHRKTYPKSLWLAISASMVSSHAVQGQSDPLAAMPIIEVVAKTGDPTEFGFNPVNFSFFDSVELLSDTVVFKGFTDAPVMGLGNPAFGSGLYYQVRDPTDLPIRLSHTGGEVPGVTTNGVLDLFGHVPNGHWDISNSGFLAFNALAEDAAGIRTVDRSTAFSQADFMATPKLITNFPGLVPGGDQGSITIKNIATGEDLGGFFNSPIWGIGVTVADRVVVSTEFGGGVPGGGSGQNTEVKAGVYIYSGGSGWVALIRSGDQAPGFETGVKVTSVAAATSKGSANVLATTYLSNGKTAFWKFAGTNNTLSLIATDDEPAPGFSGRTWKPQAPILGYASQVLFHGTATATGEADIEAFWLETSGEGGTTLDPILEAAVDGSIVTQTSSGAMAFRGLSQPLLGFNNVLYFLATARNETDETFSGIWKLDPNVTPNPIVSLVATNTEAPGQSIETGPLLFQDFQLWDVNVKGQLVFSSTLFRNSFTTGSLWLMDATGKLHFIAKEGDTFGLEPDAVILEEFFFNRYAGALEARSVALSDTGAVAFLGEIPDGSDEGTTRDSAVFRSVFKIPAGDKYFWTGELGTEQWHDKSGATTNWRDEQQMNWDAPPGTKGNEEVTIEPAASVMLNNAPADIGSLDAMGSLQINQSLTIREHAKIENLTLSANLVADGAVALTGNQNLWHSGELSGDSGVEVGSNGILTIAPSAPDAAVLKSVLRIGGHAIQEKGTLSLASDNSFQAGNIEIETGGVYELLSGAITDATSGIGQISNDGVFRKSGTGTGLVGVPFQSAKGRIDVQNGTLKMTGDTHFSTRAILAEVAKDSVLEFGDANSANETMNIASTVSASGAGTLRLAEGIALKISDLAHPVFGLTGFSGEGLEIAKASISGEGSLKIGDDQYTSARATFLDATFESLKGGITNNGVLDLGREGTQGTTALTLNKTQLVNNSVVTQYGDVIAEPSENGAIAIDNHGAYTLVGDNRISSTLSSQEFIFNNPVDGHLVKNDEGTSRISANFKNSGSLSVTNGKLQLANASTFRTGSSVTIGHEYESPVLELGDLGFDFPTEIEGSVTFNGVLKILLNQRPLALVINSGLNLADGAVFKINDINTEWRGGEIKGGASSLVEVGRSRSSTFTIRESEETRVIRVPLVNRGHIIQLATLTSNESSVLMAKPFKNFGLYEIGNNANLEALELTLEPHSYLSIERDSESRIPNLNIKGGDFVFPTTVFIGDRSKLTLGGSGVDERIRVGSGKIAISGDGTLEAKQTLIEMTGVKPSLVFGEMIALFEDVKVDASQSSNEGGEFEFLHTGRFDNPTVTFKKMEFTNVSIANSANINLEGPILFNGGKLSNNAKFDENRDVDRALTFTNATVRSSKAFELTNSGAINMQGDCLLEDSITIRGENNLGSVLIKTNSIGRIEGKFSDSYRKEIPFVSDGELMAGRWFVETDGRLILSGNANIVKIASTSDVWLHGSGQLNNLPEVTGDFTNRGRLRLSDKAIFNVSETFFNHNRVELALGATVNAKGFRGKPKSALRGKAGTVNGSVENEGTLAPGKDSATDDSDGVVVPASYPGDGGSNPSQYSLPEMQRDRSSASIMASKSYSQPTTGNLNIKQFDEDSIGVITINGDYTQAGTGVLELDLGGSSPEEYDQLIVNGTATLGGTLRLFPFDDTFPVDGTTFTPVTATAIVGQFDDIIYDLPSGRQVFEVVISETGVTASAMTLDVSTFAEWQAGVFTASALANEDISGLLADPDKDGLANLLEYALDGNPRVGTQPPVVVEFGLNAEGIPETVSATFPWANGITDVEYDLEYSTNLIEWIPLNPAVVNSEDVGLVTMITLTSELDMQSEALRFVRLIVSQI